MKLIGICTFLWMQALQADHSAETLLDNQHTSCLICKNASEPLSAQDAIPALIPVDYATHNIEATLYSNAPQMVENTYPVRGPPTYS